MSLASDVVNQLGTLGKKGSDFQKQMAVFAIGIDSAKAIAAIPSMLPLAIRTRTLCVWLSVLQLLWQISEGLSDIKFNTRCEGLRWLRINRQAHLLR